MSELSPGHVSSIIRECFPELPVARVQALPHLGWGGDCDAFLVDDGLVFLFPRRPEVARALAVEVCLLPQLAPSVALPIPRFQYVAHDPSVGVPRFVGYPVIRGEPLTPALFLRLADAPGAIERWAAQLGEFLSELHAFPPERALASGLRPLTTSIRDQVAQGYAATRQEVYPVLAAAERRFVDDVFVALLDDPGHFAWPPTLCHGDLNSDHILIATSESGSSRHQAPARADRVEIAGIIDFHDLCLGDPASDFLWCAEYGEAFFRRVVAHYRAPIRDREAFARVVALRGRLLPVLEITYGIKTGEPSYVEEGRRLLRAQISSPQPDAQPD